LNAVYVDTGAWIALFSANDEYHLPASETYLRLRHDQMPLLTSSDVIDETATRLRYDYSLKGALAFRAALTLAQRKKILRITWVDEELQNAAWELLESRPQLKLSLTDGTSAVIARRNKTTQVFGFDQDFSALGFELIPHL
jgi:predicted nucleic acid-binding protein